MCTPSMTQEASPLRQDRLLTCAASTCPPETTRPRLPSTIDGRRGSRIGKPCFVGPPPCGPTCTRWLCVGSVFGGLRRTEADLSGAASGPLLVPGCAVPPPAVQLGPRLLSRQSARRALRAIQPDQGG